MTKSSLRCVCVSAVFTALAATAMAVPPLQPKAGEPIPGLTGTQRALFDLGKADYSRPFTPAQGLGPAFNATNCAACHEVPIGGWGASSVQHFGRLEANGSFNFLEEFGGPVRQRLAIPGGCAELVPAQANHLRERVTPSVLAFGLVEALTDAQIAANADPTDANGDGVSGRVHMVRPLEAAPGSPLRAGRFGWKAQIATVLSFSGDAGRTEMGITNRVVPEETAPGGSAATLGTCDQVPEPEDRASQLGVEFVDSITAFQRYLAPPPQTPRSGMAGEAVFNAIGCAKCHVASFTTPNSPALEAALRNKTFRPYSDFLLHDMGDLMLDGIGDGIPDGDAGRFEMKTPPLWNLRTRPVMLHDGQADQSTFEERVAHAISRHGGEGAGSRTAFNALSAADKQSLLRFLGSLGRDEFDVDGNGVIESVDYAMLVARGSDAGVSREEDAAAADIDADGAINPDEMALLASMLGIDTDCNQNGILDHVEIRSGASLDSNGNGVPDECDALTCTQRIIRLRGEGGTIPDNVLINAPGSLIRTIPSAASPETGIIQSLTASLRMNHTWLSDIRATLQRGLEPEKFVLNGPPCTQGVRLASDLDGVYSFTSSLALQIPCSAPASAFVTDAGNPDTQTNTDFLPGLYRAASTTWFNNAQVQSSWTLRMGDVRPSDSGALQEWFLDIVYVPNGLSDCDQDGNADSCAIAKGLVRDDDRNGVPDRCQIQANEALDCNGNLVLDSAEIASGAASDCDGNGRPDSCDPDGDGDEVPDACDGCPSTTELVTPGACGCAPPIDTDGDGTPNCIDGCPSDPLKTAPGACGCGVADTDADGDGAPNCVDGCPNDPAKTSPGECGCGVPDIDTDQDGRKDCQDNCPTVANASQSDCNGDGVGDACTAGGDCNGNGVVDVCDIATGASSDANNDGVPDECSADCNGNGVPDSTDIANGAPDCNSNGRPDSCDLASGASTDLNGNGRPDDCAGEFVVGGTGFQTIQAAVNAASAGTVIAIAPGVYAPVDLGSRGVTLTAIGPAGGVVINGGGTQPCVKMFNITGIPAVLDKLKLVNGSGTSGGGVSIAIASPIIQNCIIENCTAAQNGGGILVNGGGAIIRGCTIRNCSASVGGGIAIIGFSQGQAPRVEGCILQSNTATTQGGGLYSKTPMLVRAWLPAGSQVSVPMQVLSNTAPLGGGIRFDPVGSAQMGGTLFCLNAATAVDGPYADLGNNRFGQDCNTNGQCDVDEIAANAALDCNSNGLLDSCDIASGVYPDCNGNGKPDSCDIASGQSTDANGDGVPDECSSDCNNNGVPDADEIASGAALDCNSNSRPDSCDIALAISTDLNGNGRPDECAGEWIVGGSGFATIQAAIDAAPSGTTIRIGAGTFSGALQLTTKAVSLVSIGGPTATVLSGTGLDRSILTMRGAATAGTVIEGITFRDGPVGTAEFGTRLGGAIFLDSTSTTIRNCRFIGNSTTGVGGAIYAYNTSGLVENCLFDGNHAGVGAGAVQFGFGGTVTVRGSAFLNNSAVADTGGLAIVQWFEGPVTTAAVENCVFRGNSATLTSSALGWYAGQGSNLRVSGCTFESNTGAPGAVGRVDSSGQNSLAFEFLNTRFCLNAPANVAGAFIDLGGNTFSQDCNANGLCDADELASGTAADCNANGQLDSCDIASGSATDCNGNGRPDLCDISLGFSTDLDGNGRLDECSGEFVVGGSGFQTIPAAIAAAPAGATIRVGPGVYTGEIFLSSKAVQLVSTNGPRATVLSGLGATNSIVRVRGSATAGTVFEGFTFRDGTAGTPEFNEQLGGAMLLDNTNIVIRNCAFTGNSAGYGGAIYAFTTWAVVENCLFDANEALEMGGAAQFGYGGRVEIRNSVFTNNTAAQFGGALHIVYHFKGTITDAILEDCLLAQNSAASDGGALSWYAGLGADLNIRRCTFDSNDSFGAACARLAMSPPGPIKFAFEDTRFCRNTAVNISGPFRNLGGNTFSQDCNANGVCDADEIASGTLADCDADGLPDTCELGRAIAWGQNSNGQAAPPASLGSPREISAGANHAVAIRSDRSVVGWGSNAFGQSAVPSSIGAARLISAGADHNIVLRMNGTVAAWGKNTFGQTNVPVGAQGSVVEVAAGGNHSGVRKSNGTLVLWGRNVEGQLNVPSVLGSAAGFALGGSHSVARRSDGSVECWGLNSSGQCTKPANVGALTAVAAGFAHTVGLRGDGSVVAWGSNQFAEATVPQGLAGVRAIAAGAGQHTLVLFSDGTVFGWGRNDFGQASPISSAEGVEAMAAGGTFSVARIASPEDCDNNGAIDTCEIASGTGADCNSNGVIDACDIAFGSTADCDGDGIPNSCEIAQGLVTDLNGNAVPDNCELVVGGSGYSSIQAAIEAASSGSTISVGPGTYSGIPLDFGDKRLTLRSTGGPSVTVLDGTGLNAPILSIRSTLANESQVIGFTFRNGNLGATTVGTRGGALMLTGTTETAFIRATITACVFENNSAEFGGAVYARGFVGTFQSCDFRGNDAMLGGAMHFRRGTWSVRNCSVDGCTASVRGGGLFAFAPVTAEVVASSFSENTAPSGAAINWNQESFAAFTLDESTIVLNQGTSDAAVLVDGTAPLVISGTFACLNSPANFAGPITNAGGNTFSGDCNGNGLCDAEDIANGAPDANGNGVLDSCEIVGDLNGDGVVGAQDIALLLGAWGSANANADLNHDGIVGAPDLAALLANWGS